MIEFIDTKSAQLSKLRDYIDNGGLTSLMNKWQMEDWYDKLGEYHEGSKPRKFSYLKAFQGGKSARDRFIGILFITSTLCENLEKMLGKPFYHNFFGEGMEQQEDNYGNLVPSRYQYASYMLSINGHKYHIGYDHRGSSIEVDPKVANLEIFNDIKELVDLYKEKVK